jgi:hypothetical protein
MYIRWVLLSIVHSFLSTLFYRTLSTLSIVPSLESFFPSPTFILAYSFRSNPFFLEYDLPFLGNAVSLFLLPAFDRTFLCRHLLTSLGHHRDLRFSATLSQSHIVFISHPFVHHAQCRPLIFSRSFVHHLDLRFLCTHHASLPPPYLDLTSFCISCPFLSISGSCVHNMPPFRHPVSPSHALPSTIPGLFPTMSSPSISPSFTLPATFGLKAKGGGCHLRRRGVQRLCAAQSPPQGKIDNRTQETPDWPGTESRNRKKPFGQTGSISFETV